MNYIYIENNTAREIVPEYDPAFPGIPVEERYSEEFVSRLIADDTGDVKLGWIYDPGTGGFSPPPVPEVTPEEELENLTDNSAESITKEDMLLAIAELAEKQEADKLETQEAIAELAESLM